jgi:tetratricopeptide (TPR) repeat protein
VRDIDWYNSGNFLYEDKQYQEAIVAYNKAIEINPKYASALYNKGTILHRLRKYEEAIKVYDEAIKIDPNSSLVWYNKGNALDELKQYQEAIKVYDEAIKIDPNSSLVWYNKGNALDELKHYEEAIEAYKKAIEINPKYAPALYNKGAVLHRLKRYGKAIKVYDEAIEINPKYASAWCHKGAALCELEKYKKAKKAYSEAIKVYDKAINIDPNSSLIWYKKGNALYELKKYKESINAYDEAIRIDQEFASAWCNKGFTLHRLKRYEEAIEAYNEGIKIDKEDVRSYVNLGQVFFDLVDLKSASENVKEALKIERCESALMLEGKIKIEEGNYHTAIKCFEETIRLTLGKPLPILWKIYARYLKIEFSRSPAPKNIRYLEETVAIIRELERLNDRLSEKREVKAYILYLLGHFYYTSKDAFTAKEKLVECLKIYKFKRKSLIKEKASLLLGNIWHSVIKPNLWQWWLTSPLYRWRKRIMFWFFSLSAVALFALLLLHPFITERFPNVWFPCVKENEHLYVGLILFLIVLLVSPSVKRIKTKDIEVELRSPGSLEHILLPSKMRMEIEKLAKSETGKTAGSEFHS